MAPSHTHATSKKYTTQNKDVVLVPAALGIKNPSQSELSASVGTEQHHQGHTW